MGLIRLTMLLLLAVPSLAAASPLPWSQVMVVPDALRALLQQKVVQPARSPEHRLRLLVDFMFDADGLALQYDTRVTGTVEQTWRSGRGNCLSFTLAFVALAREAGFKASVQEYDHALSAFRGDDLVFRSGHVNASVKAQGHRHTVDFDRELLVTSGDPRWAHTDRIAAHFYNNRGAELLAAGNLAAAADHFDVALRHDPRFVPAWSNRGVLRARSGDDAAAERDYRAALDIDGRHIATLSNLVGLYLRQARHDDVARMQRRLDEVRAGDPVYNFMLGLHHEQAGSFADARDAYARAARLQRREPRFHQALARMHLRLGDAQAAEAALGRALSLSGGGMRDALQAKLEQLRQ